MTEHTLTFLRSVDYRVLTKTHRRTDEGWETTQYEGGTWFIPFSGEVHTIDDLHEAVDAMSTIHEFFAIRGDIKPDAPHPIRRKYKDDGVVLDVDKRWLCVDIDAQPANPDKCHIEQAIALLPEWLQLADCAWQFSSSHGFKPANQLRVHLWFMLSRPVGNNSLRAWAKPLPIDGALYTPVQPHYVGDPMVIGAPDPIGQRMGLRRSAMREAVPPVDLRTTDEHDDWTAKEQQARQHAELARIAVMPPARRATFNGESVYARIVGEEIDKIRNATEGGRHHQIYASAVSVAKFAAASPAAQGARPDLEQAALAILPKNRAKEALRVIGEGWAYGIANPKELLAPQASADEIDRWYAGDDQREEKPKIEFGKLRFKL